MSDITLRPAPEALRHVFDACFQDYLRELSALNGARPNRHGRFEYFHYDRYWREPARMPFFIHRDNQPAGLLMLRELSQKEAHDGEPSLQVAELYVFRSHRRRGVAWEAMRIAARMAAALRLPLTWSAYMKNDSAVALYDKILAEFGENGAGWMAGFTRGIDGSGLARFYYKMTPVGAAQAAAKRKDGPPPV
jgi:predicted acetyltransferase